MVACAIYDRLPGAALLVDATGVGRAVLDQMREVVLNPVAVTITGGRHTSYDGLMWRVPASVAGADGINGRHRFLLRVIFCRC
jgi:hypothetical protein